MFEGDEPLHFQSPARRPRRVRQLFHRLQRPRGDQVGRTRKEGTEGEGSFAASDERCKYEHSGQQFM